MKTQIKNLIESLDIESKEIKNMIKLRIETVNFSDEGLRDALMEDPFSLELSLEDTEMDQMHAYDIGRYEAFMEIIRELKRITK